MYHELVQLAENIDWIKIEKYFEGHYCNYGRKAIPTSLLVGLLMLRWIYGLSDEAVCARWVNDPYIQYFCGEKVFQYKLPMDRSSMTRWRKRVGDEKDAINSDRKFCIYRRTLTRNYMFKPLSICIFAGVSHPID